MALTVLYFARLREAVECEREQVAMPPTATIGGLLNMLRARGGQWAAQLGPDRAFRVALNQNLATEDAALSEGDEVAIFPPVTGG